MKVKITDEQLEKIILEETKQVLEENQAINEGVRSLARLGPKMYRYGQEALKKWKASRKPKVKSPKDPGFGKFKLPTKERVKGVGFGTVGAAAAKDATTLEVVETWLRSFFKLYGPMGLLVSVTWEIIDDAIDLFKYDYDPENMAMAEMSQYSNVAEQKYIVFLEKAAELVAIPKDAHWFKQIMDVLYLSVFSLPWKVFLQALTMTFPVTRYLEYDPDVIGAVIPGLKRSLKLERKDLLDDISDAVRKHGPLTVNKKAKKEEDLVTKNSKTNLSKLRTELVKLIDSAILEQKKRSYAQGIPIDAEDKKPGVLKAMDDFLRSLTRLDKAIPDEIIRRARQKDQPTTAGSPKSPGSQPVPTAPKEPAAPAAMSKRILMKRVEDILTSNGVRNPAQREGWTSWANTTRQSGLASEDRIVSFMDKWFGSVRANVLEENRQLFTEVKLYLPKKGEFQQMSSVKSFVKWLAKNNVSLGKSEDFGLHNIGWLEYLFNLVNAEFEQKKALRRRNDRIAAQASDIKAEIDELADQLEAEQDPKKAEKIESKIIKLTNKVGKKIEKASVVRTRGNKNRREEDE